MAVPADRRSIRRPPADEATQNGNGNGSRSKKGMAVASSHDLDADEKAPSRIAPSAEGVVRFAGLPGEVREWLAEQLAQVGTNGSANGSNGTHASDDSH